MKAIVCLYHGMQIAAARRFLPWDRAQRKPFLQRLVENIHYAWVDHRPCYEYNAFGMDRQGVKSADYVRYYEDVSTTVWNRLVMPGAPSRLNILDDKLLFDQFAKESGIPRAPVFAVIDQDGSVQWSGTRITMDELVAQVRPLGEFFVKKTRSYGGKDVHQIKVGPDGSLNCCQRTFNFRELARGSVYIVQEAVRQHPEMDEFNASSVNTVRLVTAWNQSTGAVECLTPGVFSIGRKNSGVANICSGSIGVGILADGSLANYGFRDGEHGEPILVTHHLDYGYSFEGRQVPGYAEVKRVVLEAHRHLPEMRAIGWDVALSANGPIVLEGNTLFATGMLQVTSREPLRPRLKEFGF